MPINFSDEAAVVDEVGTVDDAEALLEWLQLHPQAGVDLSACTHLHAACLQALMATRARITRFPADTALASWLRQATH